MKHLVLSFIGEDRPGLVKLLAEIVADYDGNWEESRMVHLGGHFSGAAMVAINADKQESLQARLQEIQELTITLTEPVTAVPDGGYTRLQLNILGPDRAGIVREVSAELEGSSINVVEMRTSVYAAAMTGLATFESDAMVDVPPTLDIAALMEKLHDIASRLGVEIFLGEPGH